MHYFRILLPATFFVQGLFAQVTPVLVYVDPTQRIETSPYAAFLEDSTLTLDIQQVMALPDSRFQPWKAGRLNLGDSPSRFWVRFFVENTTGEDLYLLNIISTIYYLDLYVVSEDGQVRSYPPGGTLRPFNNRTLPLPNINFNLGKNPKILYAGIKSNDVLLFSNYIGAKDAVYDFALLDERVSFFCFGLYFILIVYNLVIYFNSRDTPFLWYALFQLGAMFYLLHFSGYGYKYIWRHFPILNADLNFHIALPVVSAAVFSLSFLNTRNIIPRYHLFLQIITAMYCGALLLESLESIPLSNIIARISFLLLYLGLWIAAWLVYFKGHRTARFYLVGWAMYLCSGILLALTIGGHIPEIHDSVAVNYLIQIGTTAEATFLAFALADRVREIRQQAQDAQQLLLKQSGEYEQLVQQHNHLLENNHPPKDDPAEAAKRLEALIASLRTERDTIRKISIPTMEGILLLPMADLVRIEALGSYAVFYLSSGKKITASRPIGDFEDALPKQPFFRTHKSHIVNLNCVERYIRGEGGSVVLQDGTEIGVSRTAKAELLSRLRIA